MGVQVWTLGPQWLSPFGQIEHSPHDLPPGPLQIGAIFFDRAKNVRDIEAELNIAGPIPEAMHTQIINLVVE